MRVTCENCHTTYDWKEGSQGAPVCPCCDHADRRAAAGGSPASETTDTLPPAEQDLLKTLVFTGVGGPTAAGDAAGARADGATGGWCGMTLTPQAGGASHRVGRTGATIGRGLCDIRLSDPEVSREHCAIEWRESVPFLRDLGSANGTWLNGELVREHEIADGDEIRVGSSLFRCQHA